MVDVRVGSFQLTWPTYFTGEPVWFGDRIQFVRRNSLDLTRSYHFYKTVKSIDILPVYDSNCFGQQIIVGYDALIRFENAEDNPDNYLLVSMWEGETVDKIYRRANESE